MKGDQTSRKKGDLLETIVSAFFFVLLLVLYLRPHLLAIYQRGAQPIPMLLDTSARGLLGGLLLFSLITLVLDLGKLLSKRWSMALVWASCAVDLAGALYFAFCMTRWDSLSKEFIRFFRNDLDTWALIAKAASISYLLLTLISIADDLYKAYKEKE